MKLFSSVFFFMEMLVWQLKNCLKSSQFCPTSADTFFQLLFFFPLMTLTRRKSYSEKKRTMKDVWDVVLKNGGKGQVGPKKNLVGTVEGHLHHPKEVCNENLIYFTGVWKVCTWRITAILLEGVPFECGKLRGHGQDGWNCFSYYFSSTASRSPVHGFRPRAMCPWIINVTCFHSFAVEFLKRPMSPPSIIVRREIQTIRLLIFNKSLCREIETIHNSSRETMFICRERGREK